MPMRPGLSEMALTIEEHYGRPMDIEWGKDGHTGDLFILQARPETVKSRSGQAMERFRLEETGEVLAEGRAIGQRIGSGVARVIKSLDPDPRCRRRRMCWSPT